MRVEEEDEVQFEYSRTTKLQAAIIKVKSGGSPRRETGLARFEKRIARAKRERSRKAG